jgi:phage terminase large subunit-like protein
MTKNLTISEQIKKYCREILSGKIPACALHRLACQRHLDDLRDGPKRGLFWDEAIAERACIFFEKFLVHSKGEWAGQPFVLGPWQKFIVGNLFGWKRRDGLRRFRTAYNEVPRKNGKSTLSAGIGLYLFIADGEPGAEVYSAATKRDQARIVHSEAVRMAKRSPALAERIKFFKDNLNDERNAAKYEPLGADADTTDGLNIHGATIDELHAHKTRGMVDVLETGTGARRQPLIFEITTAGVDQQSICREHRDYSEKILNGSIQDDTWFAFVSGVDEGDAWNDPAIWAKANPNLGISVKLDDLQRKAAKAGEIPAAQNAFMRLHLNIWTQQITRWISLHVWDENNHGAIDEGELAGQPCYGGLDLSSVSDLTAWVLAFPALDNPDYITLVCRFWCPEAKLQDSHNRYRDQYQAWAREGYLTTTPGNAIDYAFVKSQILADATKFGLVDLNIDRYFQAHQVAMELADEGLEVIGMGQGFLSMATPTKEFERRLLTHQINHGGNPVLRWMIDSVAVKQDPAGNIKPDKGNSHGKIDGVVSAIMALDRAMRHQGVGTQSVYEIQSLFLV